MRVTEENLPKFSGQHSVVRLDTEELHMLVFTQDIWFNLDLGLMNHGTNKILFLSRGLISELEQSHAAIPSPH